MKKLLLVQKCILSITFIATTFIGAYAQTVVGTYGRLQTTTTTSKDGKQIAIVGDENGNPISLAGMSLFWNNAWDGEVTDFYNAEAVGYLADNWKISIIRAAMGVKEDWDNGRGYMDDPDGQKTRISRVIDAAIDKGIYVIIDFHTHNAEDYKTQAITFFKEMAQTYKNNDNIIYEIYNEPIGGQDDNSRRNLWNNTIKPYAEDVIAEIRNIDPNNLIVVGTPFFDQGVDIASENPLDSNVYNEVV